MSRPSSEPLFVRGREPDAAARIEELYESHRSLVLAICRSLLRDPVEAEDAAQQTFLSAQRALANGSSPRDAVAWLATIARHESLGRVQARMREPLAVETEELPTGSDTHSTVVGREELGELRGALAELPSQQRHAILLRELRGLSYEEVAATLSVTTPAVESLIFRARRTLQVRLREALAAASPGELVQPLRELVAKLIGSGFAAPAAAKIVAVGMGTAVVAGGAVVGPGDIGFGHVSHPAVKHAAPAHETVHAAAAAPPTVWTAPAQQPVRAAVDLRHTSTDVASRHDGAERASGSGDRTLASGHQSGSDSTDSESTTAGSSSSSTQTDSSSTSTDSSTTTSDSSSTGSGSGSTSSGSTSSSSSSTSGDSGSTSGDSGSTSSGSGSTSGDSGSSSD